MDDDPPSKIAVGTAGAVGGAIATILIWILSDVLGIRFPPEVASAITTVVIAICGWLGPKFFK
jgi:hypothetical protein